MPQWVISVADIGVLFSTGVNLDRRQDVFKNTSYTGDSPVFPNDSQFFRSTSQMSLIGYDKHSWKKPL